MYTQTKKHELYFNHVFNTFKEFCSDEYIPKLKIIKGKNSNEYQFLTFVTLSLPYFNYYRNIFYPNGIKQVPLEINE